MEKYSTTWELRETVRVKEQNHNRWWENLPGCIENKLSWCYSNIDLSSPNALRLVPIRSNDKKKTSVPRQLVSQHYACVETRHQSTGARDQGRRGGF